MQRMNPDSITLNGEIIKNNANIEYDLQERLESLQTGKCPFNGKYEYDSETSASIALSLIQHIRSAENDGDDDENRVYECSHCGQWHLTSKDDSYKSEVSTHFRKMYSIAARMFHGYREDWKHDAVYAVADTAKLVKAPFKMTENEWFWAGTHALAMQYRNDGRMITILETYARDCARACWSPMVITVSFSVLDAFRVNTGMRKRMPKTVNAWIVAAFNKALRENNGVVKLAHCQPYNPALMH